MTRVSRSLSVALIALASTACGGGGESGPESDEMPQAPDTLVRPIERQPLTDADLVGISIQDLSVELPWTANSVNREAAPLAPRSLIEGVDVGGHDGFDRMTFTFSSDAPFPGYEIRIVEAGVAVKCGESDSTTDANAGMEHVPDMEGNRFLVIRARPARIQEDDRPTMSIGSKTYGLTRIHQAGVTCDADDVVTWIAGLRDVDHIRILELRSPQRLVVDVR